LKTSSIAGSLDLILGTVALLADEIGGRAIGYVWESELGDPTGQRATRTA
jgi:hypothetical protein